MFTVFEEVFKAKREWLLARGWVETRTENGSTWNHPDTAREGPDPEKYRRSTVWALGQEIKHSGDHPPSNT